AAFCRGLARDGRRWGKRPREGSEPWRRERGRLRGPAPEPQPEPEPEPEPEPQPEPGPDPGPEPKPAPGAHSPLELPRLLRLGVVAAEDALADLLLARDVGAGEHLLRRAALFRRPRELEDLVAAGAEVRLALEVERQRLHVRLGGQRLA